MGKGTITLNPYHSNHLLWSRVAVSGLLTVLIAMTSSKNSIFLSFFLSFFSFKFFANNN